MKPITLGPLAGIDNSSDGDEALQIGGKEPRLYLRDAVNINITDSGKGRMRPGRRKVSSLALSSVWQSPLHRDVFGSLGGEWVKINTNDWTTQALATIGAGLVSHVVLNSEVLAAGQNGIFAYDGNSARRFTLGVPPAPMATAGQGSLEAGTYGVAVSWLRGAMESPVSKITSCTVGHAGAMSIILPLCPDQSITGARLYLTRQNGGELLRAEDLPIGTASIDIPLLPKLGAAATFMHMEPMPTGDYLGYWRGRLVVARGSVLRLSEAMAYHIHDPRHGFIQMPQRITFMKPVTGGIWVGQVDHVAFLSGTSPGDLSISRKTSKAPIPGSALDIDTEDAGEASGAGSSAIAWLAENGYVLGSPDGSIIEKQSARLSGIRGSRGASVVFENRLLTAVI